MADNKFCVSWNPGTFGNLLLSALGIQKFNSNFDATLKNIDSHNAHHHGVIKVHPHNDSNIPYNVPTIKPYFAQKELIFFPNYLHYLKHFKVLPNKETIKNFYNIGDSNNFYKEILKIYWNKLDPISAKCFNIKIDDFFCNFDRFIIEFESYIGEKLKDQTLFFLQIKRDNNLPLFQFFTNNIVDSVNCLTQHKSKNIQHLSDYEKILIICTYVQGEWKLTSKFLNNYKGQELTTTNDIRKIFI